MAAAYESPDDAAPIRTLLYEELCVELLFTPDPPQPVPRVHSTRRALPAVQPTARDRTPNPWFTER